MEAKPTWPCLAPHPEGVTLAVKVSPNASRSEAQGLWQERLRVRIQSPPVEGKANEALKKWAGNTFGIRASEVEILQGEKGAKKTLLLRGVGPAEAARRLESINHKDTKDTKVHKDGLEKAS